MIDTEFLKQNVEVEDVGWRIETIYRYSKWIVVFYCDGITRGSVELFDKAEVTRWEIVMKELNDPSLSK